MDFKILGPLEVWHGGREVRLGAGRERALLALLLLHANEVLSSERIVDELWGERPPETAVKVVQAYVSNLRRALSQAGVDGKEMLATKAPGYVLSIEPEALDSGRFEQLSARGRALLASDPAFGFGAARRGARALARRGSRGLSLRGVRTARDCAT